MEPPADQLFISGGAGSGNRAVAEAALAHMAQPAADQSVIQRRDARQTLFANGHGVHKQGCACADSGAVDHDFHDIHLNCPLPGVCLVA